jgi:hypothetical protein
LASPVCLLTKDLSLAFAGLDKLAQQKRAEAAERESKFVSQLFWIQLTGGTLPIGVDPGLKLHGKRSLSKGTTRCAYWHAGKRVKLSYDDDAAASNPEADVGLSGPSSADGGGAPERRFRGQRTETPSHPG